MVSNNNGFEQQAIELGKLSKINKAVTSNALKNAADYYLEKLLPNIPKSLLKKKHARDHVKVEIQESGNVQIFFESTAFYWRFAENGTSKQKAKNFASQTYAQNKDKIESLMAEKIIDEMGK